MRSLYMTCCVFCFSQLEGNLSHIEYKTFLHILWLLLSFCCHSCQCSANWSWGRWDRLRDKKNKMKYRSRKWNNSWNTLNITDRWNITAAASDGGFFPFKNLLMSGCCLKWLRALLALEWALIWSQLRRWCVIIRLCRLTPIHKSGRLFWPTHSTRWVEFGASQHLADWKILFGVAHTGYSM